MSDPLLRLIGIPEPGERAALDGDGQGPPEPNGERPRGAKGEGGDGKQQGRRLPGRELQLREPKPWPGPVDGADVLGQVAAIFRRRVLMGEHEITATTLWVALTYCSDHVNVFPLLGVTSPLKRCGKTTLLGEVARLAWRPLTASNITPAAVFRVIEEWRPCLIIDEADSFIATSEELRGVLNSGHAHGTAYVIRMTGPNKDIPRRFSTWGPKVIGLIGELPSTLEDRSIIVRLQRKPAGVRMGKVREAEYEEAGRKLKRWTDDTGSRLREVASGLEPLEGLDDRANDNWFALRALALLAGGDWPQRAEAAALALSGESDESEGEARVALLQDLASIFQGEEKIATAEIIERLVALEDRPWATWHRGRPISARALASLLRPFGVKSKLIRIGGDVSRGYAREDFQLVFERYLPSPSISPVTSVTSVTSQVNPQIPSVTSKASVTDRKWPLNWDVTLVTDKTPEREDVHVDNEHSDGNVSGTASVDQLPFAASVPRGGEPVVLLEKPHRVVLRPACRTVEVELAGNILPWQYTFSDKTWNALWGAAQSDPHPWRIAAVSGDRCWVASWHEIDPDLGPHGALVPETHWHELVPAGRG